MTLAETLNIQSVNPQMVLLARLSRGFTQADLCARINVAQGTLSRIEAGVIPVSQDQLRLLCEALDYRAAFFLSPEYIDGPGLPEFYHARKRKSVPSQTLNRAYATATIQRIHVEKLLRSYASSEARFPFLSREEFDNPAKVARTVRAQLDLPPGPVFNVTDVVERAGGIVLGCDFGTRHIDGFSRWRAPALPPLFFVSRDVPPDRWRWTLAHELGHVVMHTMQDASEAMEEEANAFAEEFLMPAQAIKGHLGSLTFTALAGLKTYWKVSIQALISRAYHLQMVTDRQRRYLYTQLSRAGYRLREPEELDPPTEPPAALKEIIRFHRQTLGYSLTDLCELLGVNEPELRTAYAVDGGNLHVVK